MKRNITYYAAELWDPCNKNLITK